MRPVVPAGRLIRMWTRNGGGGATRLRAPLPFVKNTILVTCAFLRPGGLRTLMFTRSFPPAGVQRMPVVRLTSPPGERVGAGGGGTSTGPKSVHPVQPPGFVHVLAYISSPLRENRISR